MLERGKLFLPTFQTFFLGSPVGKIAEKNSPYECIFDNIALYFEFPEFKKTHSFRLFFFGDLYIIVG